MRYFSSAIAAALICCCTAPTPASAAGSFTVGLTDGLGRAPEVTPGQKYAQGIVLSAGAQPTDVLIEVLGYRQEADNGVVPLAASEDLEPYSARTFMTPQLTSVHLEAAEVKKVELSVSVPSDVGDGGRYAILRFSTKPEGNGVVGVTSAIVLPFRFTIKGTQMFHTGRIVALRVEPPSENKPAEATVDFQNTGNHHYEITAEVKIKGVDGRPVSTSALTVPSPVPDGVTRISAPLTGLSLQPGSYTAEVTVSLQDGVLLDSSSCTFEATKPYVAPAAVSSRNKGNSQDAAPSRNTPGNNTVAIVVLIVGAFLVGCLGTFLVSKRRRA